MFMTDNFIFHFEGEDVDSKLKETFGENWQDQTANKQIIYLKDGSFTLIYPKYKKPKTSKEVFECLMLGEIFLSKVSSKQENFSAGHLIALSCLAANSYLKEPASLFFDTKERNILDDFPEDDEGSENTMPAIKEEWIENGLESIDKFIENGWIYLLPKIPTASPEEDQNNCFFAPTNIFLKHFDDFEIEQFQP